MKIQITFKDPDQVYDCIKEALEDEKYPDLEEDEIEVVKEKRQQKYQELCSKWFEWGEYINLEVDTEKETIRVIPVSELKD